MPRTAFALVLFCACAPAVRAAPGDEAAARLRHQLAVQVAFEQGQDHLQRGNFEQAVAVLEKQIAHIDGNRRYLTALRDAYRGYLRQLESANRPGDLAVYRDRLAILEPRGPVHTDRAPPAALKSRGKIDDAPPRQARGLVEKADGEFAARRYEAAGRLYAQADGLQPGCVSDSVERWAYCKLVAVARALDGPNADAVTLEREVRQAVRLSAKVDGFAQKLLARLRDGKGDAVPAASVRHTPRQGNGWAVAETDNVRVLHMTTPQQAEEICRIAEATRVTMARKWFGEAPPRWSPRCDIYVHPTAQTYSKATGAPPGSPGHSTISLEGDRVVSRRVDVRADDANMLIGVLPHETTHVVLAGRFGRHHVPRWADEGMAVLSEPRHRVEMHLRNLPTHQRERTLFGLAELVRMADYPQPNRIGPFYAQSVSLVEFLVKKKDAPTFARFLRDGLDGSYEPALQRHYGYRSFAELERDWQNHALGAGGVAQRSSGP